MAEEIPVATPLVEEEFSDATFEAWEQTKTEEPSVFSENFIQPENRVEMDTKGIIGSYPRDTQRSAIQGDMARYAANTYKYQDPTGNWQSLPSDMYDQLKERGFSDVDVLTTFANVRDISQLQEGAEAAFKGGVSGTGMLMGAKAGAPYGWPGIIVGGLGGAIASDMIRSAFLPEMDIPIANPSGAGPAGEIFGGSVPFMGLPWMAKGSINLGSEFVAKNLQKLPFVSTQGAARTGNLLQQGERAVESGFTAQRQNPITGLLAESRQIAWASGAGAATETIAPGDRGMGNAAMDLAAEGLVTVTDPVSFLTRYTVNNYLPRIRNLLEDMSPERRMLNAGARLIDIFEEQGVDVDQAIALLSANPDFEGPPTAAKKALLDTLGPAQQEYLDLLQQAGIKFSDRTAGIQSGIPVLYALESTGYPRRLAEQGRDAESILDPVIQRRHTEAYNQYDMLMESLLETDTPEALGIFADMRRDKYEAELTNKFTMGFEQYQEAERIAFETGETLDSGRALHKIFFGEDGSGGILGDVNAQSRVLREAIPQDVDVPTPAIENGLLASWNNIQQKMSIRGKAPRVSSGKDLWNLDAVIKDFKDFTDPPESALREVPEGGWPEEIQDGFSGGARDKDRITFTGRNQAELDAAAKLAESGPPEPVTTKEIVNYLGALDQAKANAMRSGNNGLLEVLNDLEKGALETLDAVSASSDALGARVKARFDNYTQFKKQSNAIFSRGLLGEDLPGIGPEMTANILFNQFGNSAVMKMEAMDQAANFLFDTNDMRLPGQDLAEPVSIRDPQERMLRGFLSTPENGFFKTVYRTDPETGSVLPAVDMGTEGLEGTRPETVIEPTQKFVEFMNNDTNRTMMEKYFPEVLEDLQDVENANVAYQSLMNPNSTVNQEFREMRAMSEVLEGIYENPAKAVRELIGTPESRTTSIANPMENFRQLARTVVQDGDPEAVDGLLTAALNAGYDYAGGTSSINEATGSAATSVEKLGLFFNEPILAGSKTSLFDILKQEGVFTDQAHAMSFQRLLTEMGSLDKAIRPGRSNELGIVTPQGLGAEAGEAVMNAAIGGVGAGITSNLYGFLSKSGIVGGSGSLIASALGARLARQILTNKPALSAKMLLTSMIKDPELMASVLRHSKDYKAGDKIKSSDLKHLYTWLYGAGIVPSAMEYREFSDNYYGNSAPEQREVERANAGASRERGVFGSGGRPNPRRQAQTPPAVVPPPQASVAPPAPRPAAQAPRPAPQQPAPQGIASLPQGGQPTTQQRMQQLYPFDTLSGGGVGSLV
tara:strand:+ start:30400 stop:34257 length:3858 start_codon:yes stop_codon:yes gene_type:complete